MRVFGGDKRNGLLRRSRKLGRIKVLLTPSTLDRSEVSMLSRGLRRRMCLLGSGSILLLYVENPNPNGFLRR